MNFHKNSFYCATIVPMLLFTTLLMAGMFTGCAEQSKPSHLHGNCCQKHEENSSSVFDECKKRAEEEALMADLDEDDDEDD